VDFLASVIPASTALRGSIHGGYAQLEGEIAEYLKRNYGQ